MKRQLILENGDVFVGQAFGSTEGAEGEVVFNTGMTGYQEILSDPSYCGQIVTLTYPLVGNYGINVDDFETMRPAIRGLIVKEACSNPSNWRSQRTIIDALREYQIPGLQGIDTRRLTRVIREFGTLRGRLCSMDVHVDDICHTMANRAIESDQVSQVSITDPYVIPGVGKRIVVIDYGVKRGILRSLTQRQCNVIVVPYNFSAAQIRNLSPDGIILSNGPGDPMSILDVTEVIKELLGHIPLFGICLGHQLLALACGASTVKLKFGHRGANHPVQCLDTGKVRITSQNHNYTVDHDSVGQTRLAVTHQSVNDQTIEGLAHKDYPAFSVQFHPEAAPGPHDSDDLFNQFIDRL